MELVKSYHENIDEKKSKKMKRFSGNELVDMILSEIKSLNNDRQKAGHFSQLLLSDNVIRPVSGSDLKFKDSPNIYYYYCAGKSTAIVHFYNITVGL